MECRVVDVFFFIFTNFFSGGEVGVGEREEGVSSSFTKR